MLRKTIFIMTIWIFGSLPFAIVVGRLLSQINPNQPVMVNSPAEQLNVFDRRFRPDREVLGSF